ncbi:MAG: hypothetical protein IKA70_07020 [Alistipes sp.]|nr:hypothetical protein [Alistipes sp.]
MKRFILSMAMLLTAISFSTCTKSENGESSSISYDIEAKYLGGNYFGGEYSANGDSYNYNIVLSSDGEREVLDFVLGTVDVRQGHPCYTLDLHAAEPSANMNITFDIPVGTYTFDAGSTAPGTVAGDYSTVIILQDNSTPRYVNFVDGSVVVAESSIEATLTDTDGKTHHIIYNGGRSVNNADNFGTSGDDGEFSRLTGDLALGFAEPDVWIDTTLGDYFFVGKEYWMVSLYDMATAEEIYVELLVPMGTEKLSGEYPVSNDLYKSQMVLPGYVRGNEAYWSNYFHYTENETLKSYAPIVGGKMVVSNNNDGSQRAVFDFVDDLGNKITGTLDGCLLLDPQSSKMSHGRSMLRCMPNKRTKTYRLK